jgi:hypothetical protein
LRQAGIEPASREWKSPILPLNYRRTGVRTGGARDRLAIKHPSFIWIAVANLSRCQAPAAYAIVLDFYQINGEEPYANTVIMGFLHMAPQAENGLVPKIALPRIELGFQDFCTGQNAEAWLQSPVS